MSLMPLTLTRSEVDEYARANKYAMMMFMDASSDYFACRCCILNALHSGFRLASEAVEKLLKALIYLTTGEKTKLRGKDRHNPYLLKEELRAEHRDQVLDGFDDLFRKLYDHYQSRYFDNPVTGKGASSEELNQIDDLFIHLVETLPMPDEVKYRCKFFADLCEEDDRRYWRNYYWATERNRALKRKMEAIERRYQQVLAHLYPPASLMP
jgi:hypothetical protein